MCLISAFFCCYETFLGYELINHFRYIFVAPDCFECITIFEILVQMCLALGLMEALYNKEVIYISHKLIVISKYKFPLFKLT